MASGGRWSGQGPGEKKFDQKFWNLQILSYTNVIHLKRKLITIVIQIWNKISGFCYVKIEKKLVLWFLIPKHYNFILVLAEYKIVKKWLDYILVGMFMDKVKNFCDHSIPLREMTDNLQTTGHLWTPPPHPLGLKLFIHAFMSTYSQSFEIFVDKKLSIWQSITNFQVSATLLFVV